MSKNIKKFLLFITILSLLMIIPASFAQDSDALILNEQSGNAGSSNDYYFDASADIDGDGSQNSPYKNLTDSRIVDNSAIHLAKGEYEFNPLNSHANISIYGGNSVIKGSGNALEIYDNFLLKDITIVNTQILNRANFTASNVVFANSTVTREDDYSYGGAIRCFDNCSFYADNCTFENTYADFGGAICSAGKLLDIRNSNFINCSSYGYGGAMACLNTDEVTISKSRFERCYSQDNAGGAIFVQLSSLVANDLEISNCNATFGGAMATLETDVDLTNVDCHDNYARWYGGAFYHMFGNFTLTDSLFSDNSASNGGALFIDDSPSLLIRNNNFTDNHALECAGAIFSLLNNIEEPFNNYYSGNSAKENDDEYIASELNLNIGNGNYTIFKVNPEEIDEFPSRYSLFDDGYVTIVKDQADGGNCWAFATIAALESCILKASGIAYDFSEENMKNLAALYSDYGRWYARTNEGGNNEMALGYLASWLGPVNDSDNPYNDHSLLSPILNSIVHVQNFIYLHRDNYTDNDAIKQAILKYGAVKTSMYFDYDYYSSNGNSYYYNYESDTNHAVTIIGWDDNYSRNNFIKTPEGDGAWIVRNSWGPDWGDNGNFYVSYYDKVLARPNDDLLTCTFILNDTIKYDRNYQYDVAGRTYYFFNYTSCLWYKNIFEAGGDEFLAAVSTYFNKTTSWTVTINVNGDSKLSKSGIYDSGYYTIDLGQLLSLKKGDVFEVVFNVTVDGEAGFPISEACFLNQKTYKPGISYASWDGVNWVDLYDLEFNYPDYWYDSQVACIKAFTISNPIETSISLNITHNNANPVNITATVVDQYGNPLKYGTVIFDLDGFKVTLNVSNGKASILHNFNKDSNTVLATFAAAGYASSIARDEVDISKTKIGIDLEISRALNNVTLEMSSENDVNGEVIIYINDKRYEREFIDGKAQLYLENLANDVYTVNITLPDDSIYEFDGLIDTFVVDVKETRLLVSDMVVTDEDVIEYNVTLVDELGNVLSDKAIEYVLDGFVYNSTTVPTRLDAGSHSLTVNFNGDNDHFKSTASADIKVKTKVSLDLTYERVLNNILLEVNLSKNITDILTVTVNGQPQSVRANNGKAYLNLTDLDNGVYNISVSLNEDDYEFNVASAQVDIDVRKTQIIANDLVVVENAISVLNITLLDDGGNPVVNRSVEFYLDGIRHAGITDEKGQASITFALTNGDYVCDVAFKGDNDYFKTTSQANIKAKKVIFLNLEYSISLNNVIMEIISSDIINVPLKVKINNEVHYVNITSYKNYLYLRDIANGNYDVAVSLDDNRDYYLYNVTSGFVVDARNVKIIASDFVTYFNSGVFYNITLVDEKGNPVNEGILNLAMAGQKVSCPVSGGMISVALNLDIGEFDFSMSYEANDRYYGASATRVISVKSSIIADGGVKKTYGSKYGVKFLDKYGNPLEDSQVTFVLDGVEYTKRTDGNGYAYVDINLKPGSYDLEILNDWNNETLAKTMNVVSRITNNKDLTVYEYSNKVYKIRIWDDNGNPVGANEKVTIKIAGKTSTVKTDSNGYASFKVNLENKVYTIKATYKGFTVSNKITVKSRLVTSNMVFKKAKSYKYQAKLIDSNGKVVKNKKIAFKIKTKTYYVNTNSKGVATVTIKLNLAVGSYKITTSFGNFKETNTIKIKK